MPTKVRFFQTKTMRDRFAKKLKKKKHTLLQEKIVDSQRIVFTKHGVSWWVKPKKKRRKK